MGAMCVVTTLLDSVHIIDKDLSLQASESFAQARLHIFHTVAGGGFGVSGTSCLVCRLLFEVGGLWGEKERLLVAFVRAVTQWGRCVCMSAWYTRTHILYRMQVKAHSRPYTHTPFGRVGRRCYPVAQADV